MTTAVETGSDATPGKELELKAETAGIDYAATFRLPVYEHVR